MLHFFHKLVTNLACMLFVRIKVFNKYSCHILSHIPASFSGWIDRQSDCMGQCLLTRNEDKQSAFCLFLFIFMWLNCLDIELGKCLSVCLILLQCLKQYVELLIKEGLETAISCPDSACPKRGHLQENEVLIQVKDVIVFLLWLTLDECVLLGCCWCCK